MKYNEVEIKNSYAKEISKPEEFYKSPLILRHCTKIEENAKCAEYISNLLIKDFDILENGIRVINRENYRIASHDGIIKDPNSPRHEEKLAKRMFNQKIFESSIGVIKDYQTPLKSKQGDPAGKIDLLSVNGDYVYCLELKIKDSKETFLRCILESYTYVKTVSEKNLKESFGINSNAKIVPAPLIHKNSRQAEEYRIIKGNKNSNVQKLMNLLKISKVFVYSEVDKIGNKYIIEEFQ